MLAVSDTANGPVRGLAYWVDPVVTSSSRTWPGSSRQAIPCRSISP
jgi:hypothetical protein